MGCTLSRRHTDSEGADKLPEYSEACNHADAQPDFELGTLVGSKKLSLAEAQAVSGLLELNSGSSSLG